VAVELYTPFGKHFLPSQMKCWLARILSSPVRCFVFSLVVLLGSYMSLEILRWPNILDYSLTSFLQNLEHSEVEDLLSSIVAADAIMLASAGLIGGMILRHSARTEEKGYKAIAFIGLTLIALLLSVTANMTQVSASTIALSLIFLFAGVAELLAMLAYSLGLVSS